MANFTPLARCLLCALILALAGRASALEIPFEYRDGLIWVKVTAAGTSEPLNFLMDTGAGCSVLDLDTARRLGVGYRGWEKVRRVGEGMAVRRVSGFSAELAGVPVQADPLAVDLSDTSELCSRRIDGLIGHDFFRGRIVQIDFKARVIRLLETVENLQSCPVVELRMRNSALCVPVSVNGSRPRWTRLDTGCDGGLHWVNGCGGAVRAHVALGEAELASVPTELHRSELFPSEAGLVGNAILSNYRVTIDAVRGRLFLDRL